MKIVKGKLPITKPGIYSSIDIEDYHSAKAVPDGEYAVSSTDLRRAWVSMAHMYDGWAHNPDRAERKPTRAMILGAVSHHILLGEDKFSTKFIAEPLEYRSLKTAKMVDWNNNADVCKEWHAKQRAAGRVVVKQDDLLKLVGMARSLALEPLVKNGILEGAVECSGFFRDAETGLWVKVRPDIIPNTGGDYVDVKTIADISDRGIRRSIGDAGYHQQGALVWEWAETLKMNFETFTLAFIESARPFCARMIPVDNDDMARGRLQNRSALRKIAHCIDKGHWPGPGEGQLHSLNVPMAQREAIDAQLKAEGL